MRVFINPGHDRERDSGAVNPNTGLRECDVAAAIGSLVQTYLETAGCEVQLLQSDNLAGETPDMPCVVDTANALPTTAVRLRSLPPASSRRLCRASARWIVA